MSMETWNSSPDNKSKPCNSQLNDTQTRTSIHTLFLLGDQTVWPNELSVGLPFGKIIVFEPYWNQTNDIQIYICGFLAMRLALLGLSKDWLTQCQNNVMVR